MNTHSLNLVSSSSQAVSITDHADLKPTGNFTIEAWVKTTHTSDQIIFQSYSQNSNVAGIRLGLADSGSHVQLITGRNNGTSIGTHWQVVTGSIAVNTGNWTHVCAVYNGSTISVYVNGVLDAQTSWSNNAGYAGTNYVRIGALNTSGSNSSYFNGQLDEIRLWSDARTLQEIQDNMFQELTPGTDNLVEVWHLNNTLNSATGNHNGTGVNSPTFTTDVPNWSTNPLALDLKSSNSQYVSIADNVQSGLDLTGNLTIGFWIYLTNLPGSSAEYQVVTKCDFDALGLSYRIFVSENGAVTFQYSANGSTGGGNLSTWSTPSGIVSAGRWIHIAISFTASTPLVNFYANGILVSNISAGASVTSIYNSTAPFRLGAYSVTGTPGSFLNGRLNTVYIYNDVRTAQEIRENLFLVPTPGVDNCVDVWKLNGDFTSESGNNDLTATNSPQFTTDVPFPTYTAINPVEFGSTTLASDANLKAYYKLENVNDSSGNGFNLTNNGSVAFNSAKFGNGADFGNGNTNKTLTLSNDLGLGNGSFTLSTWVKFSGLGTSTYFPNFRDGATNTYSRFHWYQPGGYLTFYRVKAGIAQQGATYPMTPAVGDWYHLVITFDGSTVRGYVNGILVGSGSASGNGSGTSSDRFVIGTDSDASDVTVGSVNAIIDDSTVFNRVLTPTEIFELYTGLNLASSITKLSGVSRSSIKKVSSIALASVGRISGVQ